MTAWEPPSPADTGGPVFRRSGGTVRIVCCAAALTATIALSGCGSLDPGHGRWQKQMESAAGVESADWNYYSGWPTSSNRYTGRVELSPDLTTQQARAIADVGCSSPTEFSDLTFESRAVDERWRATGYGPTDSCRDPAALERFSVVLETLEATGPDFLGEVIVFSEEEAGAADEGPSEPRFRVTAETTTLPSLLELLGELRHRTPDVAFEFNGWVDGDGSAITNFGEPIAVRIPAQYEIDDLLPLLKLAAAMPHRGISFADGALDVAVGDPRMLESPDAERLRTAADAIDVPVTVHLDGPGGGDESASYDELIIALDALPEVESVTLPASRGGAEVTVRARDWESVPGILALVAEHSPVEAEFFIEGADPDQGFVRISRGGDATGAVEAYTAMNSARGSIPHAAFAALIISSDTIRMRFDLDGTTSPNDVDRASATLMDLIDSSEIDEVSLWVPSLDGYDLELPEDLS
ncbi:hypothetical protein [Leucobacter ruminantium]|uniref:Uncharacterized protein n=1 Tax=Leucobacter ruminantium TaxID=1289170 RepID=A0A939LUX8_9MICO|nr:hypothetical protein [Leucobacter ruminantium]MBO1804866.1 hypothetical protein [Leucobacter ruminantium]